MKYLILTFFLLVCNLSAQSNSFYRGQIGGSNILVALNYHQDQVQGFYKSLNSGKTYYLKGNNRTNGKLSLTEYVKNGSNLKAMASVTLYKSISSGKIIWSGTMNNYDGRNVPMKFTKSSNLDMSSSLNKSKTLLNSVLGKKTASRNGSSNNTYTKNSSKKPKSVNKNLPNLIDKYGLGRFRSNSNDHIFFYIAQADATYKVYKQTGLQEFYDQHKKVANLAKAFHERTR